MKLELELNPNWNLYMYTIDRTRTLKPAVSRPDAGECPNLAFFQFSWKTALVTLFLAALAGIPTAWAQPTLASSNPASGATSVPTGTVVTFTFSEAMKPTQNIFWLSQGGTLNTNGITYSWSADQRTLSCSMAAGWPGSSTINWFLIGAVPGFLDGFESAAGEPLQAGEGANGTFTTATSTGGPVGEVFTNSCGIVTTNFPMNVLSLGIQATYTQTSAGAPTPLAEDGLEPYSFTATAFLDAGAFAKSISIKPPNDGTIPLESFRNNFIYFYSTNDLAGLQSLFQAGTYFYSVEEPVGIPATISANLPNTAMPVIHVANFNEAQAINETQPFTLRWDPLNGGTLDVVNVYIQNLSDEEIIRSPDFGCPGALNGTSTSWVIPANTLRSNRTYKVEIELNMVGSSTEVNATTVVIAGRRVVTRFSIKTGRTVDPVLPFSITSVSPAAGGQLKFVVSPTVSGKTYQLERKPFLDSFTWSATGQSAVAGSTTVEIFFTPTSDLGSEFFRVTTP